MVRKRSGLSLKVRIFTITAAWTQWSGMQNSVLVPLLGAVLFLAMYDMWVVLLKSLECGCLSIIGLQWDDDGDDDDDDDDDENHG